MAMKAHKFVGLANPVYLPDDIQVEIAIVPSSVYNVRSNQKRGASEVTSFTVHETANYNAGANADMHKRWLHSGAGGAYVGFNLVVDDKKLIQLTPFDEVTWAAGTPGGNRTSDHLEICVNSDINHTKARRNGAAVAAGVLKARGISINSGLVQHNMWTRKNCPALMRANNNAIWNNTFVPMVKEFYAGGSNPEPTPSPNPDPTPAYEKASPVQALADERPFLMTDGGAIFVRADVIVEAVRDTPRLKYAGGSARVGPDVLKGQRFAVDYLIVNNDMSLYWLTPWSTRIKYEDTRIIEEG